MKKVYLIGMIVVIAIAIIVVVALYNYPKANNSHQGLENYSKIPHQTQGNISDMEIQEKLNSTKALLKAPVGGFHKNFIWLKPGDTQEIYYTFYTQNDGPGELNYEIYRVAKVYEKEEMAMPNGLNVSIEPSKYIAEPHKNYTSKITVNASSEIAYRDPGTGYTLHLQAHFEGENETIIDDWVRVLIAPYPIPGASGLYQPHGSLHVNSLTLEPGEVADTYFTFHTGGGGIGEITYKLYRITGKKNVVPIPEEEKLPMPNGLNISIEPSKFISRNFMNYTTIITVKTSPELPSNEYILCFEISSSGMLMHDFLTVNVI